MAPHCGEKAWGLRRAGDMEEREGWRDLAEDERGKPAGNGGKVTEPKRDLPMNPIDWAICLG